jgi:hypothetical protein
VLDVELPPERWRPLDAAPGTQESTSVLFVDGVRRVEAIAWGGTGPDGVPAMGLFASCAAGVVRCRPGRAELLDAEVRRSLVSGALRFDDVVTRAGRFAADPVGLKDSGPPPAQQLADRVQRRMRELEATLSQWVAAEAEYGELLVLDGPLNNQVRRPHVLGYAKTHGTFYLPTELNRLVGTLATGQRTPVFGLGDQLSWYLKLPGGSGAPWAGVVRVECWARSRVAEALELAARSQRTLPRYASAEYKDARAPQNLYPIGGLERQLRRRLGDQALLHRAIRAAIAAHARPAAG